MEMSDTDKEIRTQSSSFPYNNYHLIHECASEPMDNHGSQLDRFDGPAGASATPISVGSRLLKSPPRYRECLKNHAANTGGNITDGCGEFMPSGDEGTLEALKCAACNCHRNFHRKETTTVVAVGPFLHLPPPLPSTSASFNHHPSWPTSSVLTPRGGSTYPPINAPPLKIAVGGSGFATESSSDELHFAATPPYVMAKKRFRSKFTPEQKEKMVEFAERVGWRIPREDDAEVHRFCLEIGVKRQVLKVWMHNNKAISVKKLQVQDSNETID